LTYAVVGALLLRGWCRRGAGLLLLSVVGATLVWALAGLAQQVGLVGPAGMMEVANSLRAICWVWLGFGLLSLVRQGEVAMLDWASPLFRIGAGLACVKLASALLAGLAPALDWLAQLDRTAGLVLAVLGLLLVENVYAAADRSARWAVKHLLIAAGFLFAFDMFRYSDALLIRRFGEISSIAQPLLAVIVAPLIVVAAARIRQFAITIHVARRFVLETSALLASGAYLLLVALVGFLLRRLDLVWGPALQVASMAGALVLLVVLLSSGQARAHGRRLVERTFFNFAYDYREEWLRFVATMAEGHASGVALQERAIRAVAEPLDCSAGLLGMRGAGDRYHVAAAWNWAQAATGLLPSPEALARLDSGLATVVDLRQESDAWPGAPDGTWLLLGLRARGRAIGFLLLGRPRMHRRLTWEDQDLLGMLAAEVASYLAEEQTARALADAQRLEAIGKSFSFVAHDLKNLVTQLSLLLQQARRHGAKPEFMHDTLLTVGDSVDKMQAMLLRLRDADRHRDTEPVDLTVLLADVGMRCGRLGQPVDLELSDGPMIVATDADSLGSLIEGLVANAREAGGTSIPVAIGLRAEEGDAIIEVCDQGPGMSPAVVERRLFRPLPSAKATGFGLGLYQCRESLERWGGRLEVESTLGLGTRISLVLPLLSGHGAGHGMLAQRTVDMACA
jgi:putative PEP-CTERM system histidine kinase